MFLTSKIEKLRNLLYDMKKYKTSTLEKHLKYNGNFSKIHKKFTYSLWFGENGSSIDVWYEGINIMSADSTKWDEINWNHSLPKKMIKELENEVNELLKFYKQIDKNSITDREIQLNNERERLIKSFK